MFQRFQFSLQKKSIYRPVDTKTPYLKSHPSLLFLSLLTLTPFTNLLHQTISWRIVKKFVTFHLQQTVAFYTNGNNILFWTYWNQPSGHQHTFQITQMLGVLFWFVKTVCVDLTIHCSLWCFGKTLYGMMQIKISDIYFRSHT